MGRCVVVTGASGGIGQAMVVAFAQNGDRVVAAYNRNPAAVALCEELQKQGAECVALQGDLRSENEVRHLFEKARAQFGPVQVLVNNAGVSLQKMLCDTTAAEWDDLFAIHARAAFLCAREALADMVPQKSGNIVNVSSMWGRVGASCEVAYSAAKAALIGFTKALAKEVAPSGIRVNCVAPGAVSTAMLQGYTTQELEALCEEIPLGRLGSPDEIAQAVCFLASDAAAYITGQVLGADGGFVM